jgi:hypothetical protein
MPTRIMKSLAKFTAAATVASAAALTASALPASAATTLPVSAATPKLQLFGTGGNQVFICTPPEAHGVDQPGLFGITAVTNQCSTRVWLHEFGDGSGWSFCVSPRTAVLVPAWAEFANQLLVSENTAAC